MLTFVCCVEYGRLEQQTLLMIESLRTFGGDLSSSRLLAVKGRRGPALMPSTLRAFDRLNVEFVEAKEGENPHPWLNYTNKVVAVKTAERMANTDTVAWLDSDIFVLGGMSHLLLNDNEDFTARREWLPPAMFKSDAHFEPYWRDVCQLLGTSLKDMPWLATDGRREEQLAYFNSGLFSWRRGSGFADAYQSAFSTLLRSKLATPEGQFFTADQVVLSPIITRLGLRWRELGPDEHNMVFQGLITGPAAAPSMSKSSVVHYSRSMEHPYREAFMQRLVAERQEFANWLKSYFAAQETINSSTISTKKIFAKALRIARGAQYRLFDRATVRSKSGRVNDT
ncbi:hypothetical protein [Pseudomonas sp. Teo4]|uniref:hypothetical protein n=1 Tax=Pseudomonas sp. Teo4 TaxID=3064528 RepID=UPI002ABB63FE|nr:hypothetical protein [Pseudomonas sp. Teo4]MDZ3990952.1 hypothetical protein [Pseudomonas sp. Teo4]